MDTKRVNEVIDKIAKEVEQDRFMEKMGKSMRMTEEANRPPSSKEASAVSEADFNNIKAPSTPVAPAPHAKGPSR